MGSVERALGNTAMLAGDLDAAAGHFERALDANIAIGAPLPVANTRRQYAELLRRRAAPGDADHRQRLLREALAFYEKAGIGERVDQLRPMLVESPALPSAVDRNRAECRWERTGAGWSVTFRDRTAMVPAVKGMADLARLLAHPDAEVHVLDLVGPTAGAVPRQGHLGDVLDDRARAAYRQRLHDLDERIADAEADGDTEAPRDGDRGARRS